MWAACRGVQLHGEGVRPWVSWMIGCRMAVRGVGVYGMSVGCMGAEFHEGWTVDEVERKVGLVGLKMSGAIGGEYGGRVGALWAVRVRCERGAAAWWRCGLCGWAVRWSWLHGGGEVMWVSYEMVVAAWWRWSCMCDDYYSKSAIL